MKNLSRPRRIAALYLELLLMLFIIFIPIDDLIFIIALVLGLLIVCSIPIAFAVLLGKG